MEQYGQVRTVVCDDEPDAREGIVRLLRDDTDMAVVGEARNGLEAVDSIARLAPDLVFLDVQMPGLDGFEVVRRVGAGRRPGEALPVTVFVTAYDAYALEAFAVHALDYLLKPFADERFTEALAQAKVRVRQRRASELSQDFVSRLTGGAVATPNASQAVGRTAPEVAQPPAGGAPAGQPYIEHIMVRLGGTVTLVHVEDVDWIEAEDYYARLHVGGHTHLIRETMQRLESRLDPRQFVRVHRSAIVRIDRVRTLQPYFKGSHILTLRDGARLPLSRGRRAAFEAAVGSLL